MQKGEFLYWLQGHFELQDSRAPLSREQVAMIDKHLNLVKSFGPLSGMLLELEPILAILKSDRYPKEVAYWTRVIEQKIQRELTNVTNTQKPLRQKELRPNFFSPPSYPGYSRSNIRYC